MGPKALVRLDEKVYHIIMGKTSLKIAKKVVALSLALVLLFNISGQSFAALILPQNETLSEEIKTVLQETLAQQQNSNYTDCVNKKSESACKTYLEEIKSEFKQTAKESADEDTFIEEKKDYPSFEKEYKQEIEKKYEQETQEIEKEKREALLFSSLTWDDINHINYWEKKNKSALDKWKAEETQNIQGQYKKYEQSYDKWRKNIERKIEAAGQNYLKEEVSKIISVYNATANKQQRNAARELLVILLNNEETPGQIVTEREKAAKIFREGLQGNPCAYTLGSKTLTKAGADKYIGYDKPGIYPELKQEDWQIIPAAYKDEESCKSAFASLQGLSYLNASKENLESIVSFMEENQQGLVSGDSLLTASAVLLKLKAYKTLKNYLNKYFALENKNNQNKEGFGGFGEISEDIAYNGKYLGDISIYSQREDGTNAWEELAALLAEEASPQSQEMLKSAVSSCKVEKEIIGQDKLECQTIMPFLYGAVLYAPKVIDKAQPYQQEIPREKEYMDKSGRILPVDKEDIKRKNAAIKKDFNEKMRQYGSSLSAGLAGFLYNIKFNDMPVDSKMTLDNKLAQVYKNLPAYSKGSKRYNTLKRGRQTVAIFKYAGIGIDILCFISLIDLGVGVFGGARALIKAKKILKGAQALSVAQRANLLRQVAYIKEGAKLRRFGHNTINFMINSGNIGRRINAGVYLAKKNNMSTVNYMLHNIAYNRGKNLALTGNILRVEGLESGDFFGSSHYIAGKHKDIFRIKRDIKRASKIGVKELGENGTIISYVEKAKMKMFKEYTQDYLKAQTAEAESANQTIKTLMSGQTNLLPREFLYSKEYETVIPFVQKKDFARTFNLGDKIYSALNKQGFYVYNTATGQVFKDFIFHFDGYLNSNNLLGGLTIPGKNLAKVKNINLNSSYTVSKQGALPYISSFVKQNKVLPSINTNRAIYESFYSAINTQNLGKIGDVLAKHRKENMGISLDFSKGINKILNAYSNNAPAFTLLAFLPLTNDIKAWLTGSKYLSAKDKAILPAIFDMALTEASQAYIYGQHGNLYVSKEDFVNFAIPFLQTHLSSADISDLQTKSLLKDFKNNSDLLIFSIKNQEGEIPLDEINIELGKNLSLQIDLDFDFALTKALEQSDKLELSAKDVRRFFGYNEGKIKNTISVIGVKAFVHSYQTKLSGIKKLNEYASFVKNNFSDDAYELLLQKINPQQSQKYLLLTRQVNFLREKASNDLSFRPQRDFVTSLQRKTARGSDLLVQDALDKFKIIASIATYDLPFAQNLVAYILPKTPENELVWQEKYRQEMFKTMDVEIGDDLLAHINLGKDFDIVALLNAKQETKDAFKEIFKLIYKNPNKEIAEIMENLPWNQKTKEVFTKLGVNWNAWTRPNPENIFKTYINLDAEKEKAKFVKEVNAQLKEIFNTYPVLAREAQKKNIFLYKDIVYFTGHPITSFAQASKAISTLKKMILSSYNAKIPSLVSSKITEDLSRVAEMLNFLNDGKKEIIVRLADTNDIGLMSSLGANSASCRRFGGKHEEAIASLITNKMATAFEILADGKVVGSILVYLASVNGNLSLVLGTLETRSIFAENETITKAVLTYARQFAAEIGKPNIPIYTAVLSQDEAIRPLADQSILPPDMAKFFPDISNSGKYQVQPIGKIGKYPLYLSYDLSSKTKWENLATRNYLFHINYFGEEKQKVSLPKKIFFFLSFNSVSNKTLRKKFLAGKIPKN